MTGVNNATCPMQMSYVFCSLMQIELDPFKASSNLKKHGVSFDEAAESLLDPSALVEKTRTPRGRCALCWWECPAKGGC